MLLIIIDSPRGGSINQLTAKEAQGVISRRDVSTAISTTTGCSRSHLLIQQVTSVNHNGQHNNRYLPPALIRVLEQAGVTQKEHEC